MIKLQEQVGTGTLRARPHGTVVSAADEYFTGRVPSDGSDHVSMTGFVLPTHPRHPPVPRGGQAEGTVPHPPGPSGSPPTGYGPQHRGRRHWSYLLG